MLSIVVAVLSTFWTSFASAEIGSSVTTRSASPPRPLVADGAELASLEVESCDQLESRRAARDAAVGDGTLSARGLGWDGSAGRLMVGAGEGGGVSRGRRTKGIWAPVGDWKLGDPRGGVGSARLAKLDAGADGELIDDGDDDGGGVGGGLSTRRASWKSSSRRSSLCSRLWLKQF